METQIKSVVTTLLLLVVGSTLVVADGDPAEIYDSSGNVDPDSFIEKMESETYHHGLWTIQSVTRLQPFGTYWKRDANTEEHINIFYGNRPIWQSEVWPKAAVRFPSNASTRFWTDEDGKRTTAQAGSFTGSDSLEIAVWGRWARGVGSLKVLRLLEHEKPSCSVEILWEGSGYDNFVDLNEDGIPEIVARDLSHDGRSYCPYAYWPRVIYKWDTERAEYVCVQKTYMHEEVSEDSSSLHESAEAKLKRYRDAVGAGKKHPFYEFTTAVVSLLYVGRSTDVLEIVNGAVFDSFEFAHEVEPAVVTKNEWWRSLVTGCWDSRIWKGLGECFPKLAGLNPELSECE